MFAATFRVAAERLSAVANDASLALSPRDRASLFAFFGDLVGAGLPDSLVSAGLCEEALALYDSALALFPALSAEAWYHSGYTELMLLKLEHPRASLQGVKARLWGALEQNATFEASLAALKALGLEPPGGSGGRPRRGGAEGVSATQGQPRARNAESKRQSTQRSKGKTKQGSRSAQAP